MTEAGQLTPTVNAISFDDAAALEESRCGRKATVLAQLRRAGFPVPDGIVLPVELVSGWSGVQEAPEPVRAAVRLALERFAGAAVAVRSSAIAEDLDGASFAGAYESVLNVVGEAAVIEAVRRCLEAAHSERIAAYRGADGSGTGAGIAVLIQPMVAARVAGIAFTADPVTGDQSTTRVSAAAGLGDRLASGEASGEEWDVRSGIATRRSGHAAEVLDADGAAAVAALAARIAEERGAPQDVEWAESSDGRLVVLQARPITVLPAPPTKQLSGGGWQKDRAHFPEPVTPFGSSIYVREIGPAVAQMCERFGLMIKELETEVVGGEIYVRPQPVFGPVEAKGPPPPAWLLGLLSRVIPALRRRNRQAQRALDAGLLEALPRRWNDEWRDELSSAVERLLAVELSGLDEAALVAHGDQCLALVRRGQEIHFELFLPYVVPLHELYLLCEELLGWDLTQTVALLSGHSPASVAGRSDLRSLASAVARSEAARSNLRDSPGDPVAALRSVDGGLAADLERWISRHAWRTANYDAGSPTLAERPGLVTALLLAPIAASPIGRRGRPLNWMLGRGCRAHRWSGSKQR